MKKAFIFLFFVCLPFFLTGQDFLWAKQFGGPGDNKVFKSTIDNQNNIYVIGSFTGTVTAGSTSYLTYGTDSTKLDVYVSKYDKDGNLLWFKRIGSKNYDDYLDGLVLSADQAALYIVGGYSGDTCKFGDGFNLTNAATGTPDAFLAKLRTSDGLVQDVQRYAYGSGTQRPQAIRIDKNSNFVIIGFVQGNTFVSHFSATDSIVGGTTQKYYILQLSPSYTVNWLKTYSGTNNSTKLFSLDVDNTGYYIAGTNVGTVPSPGNLTLDIGTVGPSTSADMFLYKTDLNGTGQWIRNIKGSGSDVSVYATCDQLGYVYISGYYASSDLKVDSISGVQSVRSISNAGSNDLVFAKYTTNDGTLQKFFTRGSTGDDQITRLSTNGKYIVIAGQYGGSMTFAKTSHSPRGGIDAFGAVLDAELNELYFVTSGGSGTDVMQTCVIGNKGKYYFISQGNSPTYYFTDTDFNINPTPTTRDVYIANYDKASIDMVKTNITCPGANDGGACAYPQGAWYGSISYLWTMDGNPAFSAATQCISNLAPGTYRCTLTDELGYSKQGSTTITDPVAITLDSVKIKDVTCYGGSDGSITIYPSGGKPPYSTYWTTSDGGGTMPTAIPAGHYYVEVTDANGCIKVFGPFTVTQGTKIEKKVDLVDSVSAIGVCDGTISITVTGGTSPYSFHYTSPDFPGLNLYTEDLTNLCRGQYNLHITDSKSCSPSDTLIFVPGPDTIECVITPADIDSVMCFGSSTGAIRPQVNGYNPPFTYYWTPGGYTTKDISGVPAGTYTLRIRDSHLPDYVERFCSATIYQNDSIKITGSVTDVKCYGGSTGKIILNVLGGVSPYTYLWSKESDATWHSTSKDLINVPADCYTVIVTDYKGCSKSKSLCVTQPLSALSICSVNITDQTCRDIYNGSICISVCGGTPPYSYLWSNNETTACITSLRAGYYCVSVTDANGCQQYQCFTVNQPSPFVFVPTLADPKCYGGSDGSIKECISGGTSPYDFYWSTGKTELDVSCSTVTGLDSGQYDVHVIDAKNCSGYDTISLSQPDSISISEGTFRNVTCFGKTDGFIQPAISGGVPSYQYAWLPNGESSKNISALGAGDYTITVTDYNNCEKQKTFTITEPSTLNLSEDLSEHVDNTCADSSKGSLQVSASGGNGTFEFNVNGGSWQTDSNFVSLAANTYMMGLRDKLYPTCIWTGTLQITINEPELIAFGTTTPSDISCFGLTNGIINAAATGGTGTLAYTISPGDSSNASGTFVNLPAGSYQVSVTDDNLCGPVTSSTLDIAEPLAITIASEKADSALCFQSSDGMVTVVAQGGSTPYNYLLTPGNTSNSNGVFSGLIAGSYQVSVTDANNCDPVSSSTLVVNEPAQLAFTLPMDTARDNGGNLDVSQGYASGGTEPYSYSSAPTATENTEGVFSGLVSGQKYLISVSDANGCGPVTDTVVYLSTGIWNPKIIVGVRVYPNPFQETVTYSIDHPSGGKYQLELVNSIGQVVKTWQAETVKGVKFEETLNLHEFTIGIYLLKINDGEKTGTLQIIKN